MSDASAPPPRPSLFRRVVRLGLVAAGAVLLLVVVVLLVYRPAFGAFAEGERLARMQASPQWKDGIFENPQPLWNDFSLSGSWEALTTMSDFGSPVDPEKDIPVVRGDGHRYDTPPASGLRITWFGHSSILIELDGKRILTDPVWGPAASPIPWLGPQRWYAPAIALEDLPPIDAVVISHDHYDHLDYPTFQHLKDWDTTFFVPLGVAAHLEYWGVPVDRIVELDWWERGRLGDLEVVCTPARHASGRGVRDQGHTLWAGWAFRGPEHRVFFSGDTGLFDDLARIGDELGPFDLAMLEVGAYGKGWPDWHLGPEQAVQGHQWVKGKLFLPIHWGLFDLAGHGWTAPAERTIVAAQKAGVSVVVPPPGTTFEPAAPPLVQRWWPEVPWLDAEAYPIVSTDVDGRPARAR